MKVGDLIADKEFPDIVGIIFKIDPDDIEPYYVFSSEGQVVQVDQEYMYKLWPMLVIEVDGTRAKFITFRGEKEWTAVKHLEVLSESR